MSHPVYNSYSTFIHSYVYVCQCKSPLTPLSLQRFFIHKFTRIVGRKFNILRRRTFNNWLWNATNENRGVFYTVARKISTSDKDDKDDKSGDLWDIYKYRRERRRGEYRRARVFRVNIARSKCQDHVQARSSTRSR